MKWLLFTALSFSLLSLGTAQLKAEPETFTLERNGIQISVERLKDKRLSYSKNGSKNSAMISVENTDRPGRKYHSNISQRGIIAIFSQTLSLEELAQKEKKQHSVNYVSTTIEDLPDGSKLLIYEGEHDNYHIERRVFLWWREGDSTIMLDFTYMDFAARKKAKNGRQFMVDTLMSLRVDGKPVPAIPAYLEILAK